MWKKLRKYGRVVNALIGFLYDFKRFYLYSAWKADMQNKEIRNYHMVKVYHSLEKSLSFKRRNKESGWSTAKMVLELIKIADSTNDYGFHDKAGLSVLKKFINHPDNTGHEHAQKIKQEIKNLHWSSDDAHGTKHYKDNDLLRGKLINPEAFFLSRYSLREFKQEKVEALQIERAISLAMKTPSVCNRQAWHVYHSDNQESIRKALSYQQGNRGFGDEVPNLMIITSDLKAFMPGQEHYQHWIDGGLFSMSLIYAFHSLGIVSCCLNWSQSPSNDLKLRSTFNIRPNDTVIMMLAFGYPDKDNNVCVSARRPLEEIYTKLEMKDKAYS
ncbi:MAG: nitroreductase family protein [Methyloprofundus sp.]|nr:nitroreductase family protein [Methyloprofundus sp.]